MIDIAIKMAIVGGLLYGLVVITAQHNARLATRLFWLGMLFVLVSPLLSHWTPLERVAQTLPRQMGLTVSPVAALPHVRSVVTIRSASDQAPPMTQDTQSQGRLETGFFVIWLAGATLALGLLIVRLWRLGQKVHRATPWRQHQGVPVVLAAESQSAFLWCLGAPKIVLPEDARHWPEQRINHVIQHEYVHWQRQDGWTVLLAHIIWAVYWWHPVIRALVLLHDRISEDACDEEVIHRGTDRVDYAGTLLACTRAQQRQAVAGLGDTHQLQRRIKRLLHQPAPRRLVTVLATVGLTPLLIAAGVVDTGAFHKPDVDMIAPAPVELLSEYRGEGPPSGTLQIVLFYDGAPNPENFFDIEFVDMQTGSRFWSRLGSVPKFDIEIPAWELSVSENLAPSGRIRTGGMIPDGVVDGIAYGIVWRDHDRAYHSMRSTNPLPVDHPNAVCTWPLALIPFGGEIGFTLDEELWQVNSVRHAICGAELVPSGTYRHDL